LQNAVGGHDSEFLRTEQSVDQIGEEKKGGDAADDEIHGRVPFLQVIASFREKPAHDEERESDGDVEDVKQHSNSKLTA
jgi:hypothetical protein